MQAQSVLISMHYDIIESGSSGNATVLENTVMFDCGVPIKLVRPYVNDLRLVLLTHIHGDHFYKPLVRWFAENRPSLRWGCGEWMLEPLLECGVAEKCIDVLSGGMVSYGGWWIKPIRLVHNVPNMGWIVRTPDKESVMYATDTGRIDHVSAPNLNLYLIEANHTEEEIRERIEQKKQSGEFSYEIQASRNHLSKEQADAWLADNMGKDSKYCYMHIHKERI